jgi:hypothetical protein
VYSFSPDDGQKWAKPVDEYNESILMNFMYMCPLLVALPNKTEARGQNLQLSRRYHIC